MKRKSALFFNDFRILEVLLQKKPRREDVDFYNWLARMTPGYVGSDLVNLANEAGINAANR